MRIAFISGVESAGGAARAAIRLHDALAVVPGVRLRHFTGRVDRAESTAVCFTQPGRLRSVMNAAVRAAGWEEAGVFRRWQGSANRRNLLRRVREWGPDVIHLHNISPWTRVGFGREIVPDLAAIAPVVWRMPDMWPVSGCCSYTDFCERGGVDCSWAARRETPPGACGRRAAAERDALAALGERLVLASPSSWLAGVARDTFGARLRVEHILSGLDLDVWKPLDRAAARLALGLDAGGVLVLAVAERLSLRLKGAGELLAALETLGPAAPRLLSAGRIPPADLPRFPAGALHLGSVNDDRVLRLAYAAADVVAVPSLADNLPGVAVEALACGRPVVAFQTGGIPDVVRPGETGWLAPRGDTVALAAALRAAAAQTPDQAALMSDRCRDFARRECDGTRQARRYLELFPETTTGPDPKS
ncbi:MAG: glycosyltransferase [Kiritimatiellia bacterium]